MKKCNICEDREATVPIQLCDEDICSKCFVFYLKARTNMEIPSHVPKQQFYRYIRIKVRKELGY